MKYLFLLVLLVLVAAGVGTVLTEPDLRSEVPVIYWATDLSSARFRQVDLFHQWLIDEGHTTTDGKPVVELRLDLIGRSDNSKKLVQSVAGVASDVMDCSIGQMYALGVLEDVTDEAQALGFDVSKTYAAIEPELVRGGRQYGFPCNVSIICFFVNTDRFKELGVELPPDEWDYETFERIGRDFVSKANPPGERQTVFFCDSATGWRAYVFLVNMIRSQGLSVFNETMTRCTLDDDRFAEALSKLRQWVYDDHLMPSAAEEASISAESGFSGASLSLFYTGRYGMIFNGRWSLIRLREFDRPMQMSVSNFPTSPGGFANNLIGTRGAAIYKGSKHKDLAALFLSFLASEPYNQQIVEDADALPPNPAFAETDAYRKPAAYPNEWGVHEAFSDAATRFGVANDESPFVSVVTVSRLISDGRDKVLTDPQMATSRDAAGQVAAAINQEIALSLKDSDTRRALYDSLSDTQAKIDKLRAEGKKVPLEWITNPFHRRYYVKMGWAEVPAGGEAP
ncbi:MAG: extracellular solute-binding protein [Phycisphaerales bacterium]